MPRAFLAISLPLAIRSTFVACREAFTCEDPQWREEKWVTEQNLHVTLRFLGTISEPAVPHVIDAVRTELSSMVPYRLRLDVARAVPRPRSASLVWVACSVGGEETADLAERIARAVRFLDYEPDGRAFKTHVTLCRARHPRRVIPAALDEIEHLLRRSEDRAVEMSVREATLYASTLTPRGPLYEELAIIPFGG
ncbi:MAG: RNA 2',3'-cyclic phosphodiesterase [Actinobacteria bacterium]|nr:RNA 2',3'-cyclic phosphodiesterase [Actinomycetota bacterium]